MKINDLESIASIIESIFTTPKKWFYGIEGIEFKSNGSWSDPHIIYKDHVLNYYDVESRMYEYYTEEETGVSFEEYMSLNKSLVFDEIDDLIQEGYYIQ